MDDFMPDGPTTVNVIEYLEFVVCFCTDGTPPDQLVAKLTKLVAPDALRMMLEQAQPFIPNQI